MSTLLANPPARKTPRVRAVPPVLDAPDTLLHSPTILLVEHDAGRRDHYTKALADVPAKLIISPSPADAYIRAQDTKIALVIVDGRDDPRGTIDFFRKLRATQPFVVSILLGIEWDRTALLDAINDIQAFRVLSAAALDVDLRGAVLSGLRAERDRREAARMSQTWVRDLLNKVEAALPSASLRNYEERGEPLPFDLIMRPPTAGISRTAHGIV